MGERGERGEREERGERGEAREQRNVTPGRHMANFKITDKPFTWTVFVRVSRYVCSGGRRAGRGCVICVLHCPRRLSSGSARARSCGTVESGFLHLSSGGWAPPGMWRESGESSARANPEGGGRGRGRTTTAAVRGRDRTRSQTFKTPRARAVGGAAPSRQPWLVSPRTQHSLPPRAAYPPIHPARSIGSSSVVPRCLAIAFSWIRASVPGQGHNCALTADEFRATLGRLPSSPPH